MTNHKPAIINPVMGQSAPFTQHQQAGNRHPANRHRHTPKKPRYAHKVQQQGKDTSQASTAPKTAQNSTNTGANKAGFGIGGNHNQPSRQHPAKSHPKQRQRADLARLPSPIDFYHTYGLTLKGGGVWRFVLFMMTDTPVYPSIPTMGAISAMYAVPVAIWWAFIWHALGWILCRRAKSWIYTANHACQAKTAFFNFDDE